jgi:hypothetical protein
VKAVLSDASFDDGGELLLVERDGACPGDPDSEIIAMTAIPAADLVAEARGWLARRCWRLGRDARVDIDRPPTPTRAATAREPGTGAWTTTPPGRPSPRPAIAPPRVSACTAPPPRTAANPTAARDPGRPLPQHLTAHRPIQ